MTGLRDAAGFLTRLPVATAGGGAPNLCSALPWFAGVGVVLGVVQGALYVGLNVVSTSTVAAAVSAVVLGQITGTFDHDGLAEVANEFGGRWRRRFRPEAPPESRLGIYGLTAVVFVIMVEIGALSSVSGWTAVAATVAAHAVSRAVVSFMLILAPPSDASGLGVEHLEEASRRRVVGVSLAVAAGAVALFGVVALPVIFGAYGAGTVVVRLADGATGEISVGLLGAIQQVAKIVTLVIIVIADEVMTKPGLLGGLALG